MEPEHRIKTNNHGFCGRHFRLLFEESNKLSLALVLESHLMQIEREFFADIDSLILPRKRSFFGCQSKQSGFLEEYLLRLEEIEKSCTMCKQIHFTMDRYFEVAIYLWQTEHEFRDMFENSKGFCLPHFKCILKHAVKQLKEPSEFIMISLKKQKDNFKRLEEEITWFTKKFDYRNKDAAWGNSEDAVIRTIQKINSTAF